ncbi:MAG TPA: hypothetical protein VMZ03_09180 [Chitinophagaceae bacterium]|nr:hypothetical protein [Chitinophagaceae bacterium]
MKSRILTSAAIFCAATFLLVSCQKSNSDDKDYSAESTTHSDDQNRFSVEMDAAANDVNGVLETTTGFAGRGGDIQSICDATIVVDTMSNPRTITITFNGTNCLGNRTRTGVIVVSMAQGVRWKNAGAQLNVTFQNFKITRLADNKSITVNGTETYTNVSGGLLINLASLNTITHTINSSNMSVTFDNGSQRNWQVGRQRVFSYNGGNATITVTGTHTQGSTSGIAEWGTNRFGNAFTTAITLPLTFKYDCSFRLGSGRVEHVTNLFNASVIFGLDANGNPTGCPGANPYYMKIVWTGPANIPHTIIWPY